MSVDVKEIAGAAGWEPFDKGQPRVRYTMDSAPRDGTAIYLCDPDVGEFPMQWAHIQRNGLLPGVVGMWTAIDGSMTWDEEGGFGPTSWRPLNSHLLATEPTA